MLSCLTPTLGDKVSSVCETQYSWMAVLGLVVYIMGFAPGMGPLPWTINSEIFPNWSSDTAMAITTTTNWICNSIISQVRANSNWNTDSLTDTELSISLDTLNNKRLLHHIIFRHSYS